MTTPDPLVGTRLGPCRLDALIGRGGMGRVYKALHIALDRLVAVKLVDEGGAAAQAARAQVLEEARAAARLEDPRVVAVYEVGEDRGLPYIVMQWVEGESLEARVKRAGPLAPQDAVAVVRETALALKAAHAAGIVHRDVKPGNILIDRKGGVKLTDFGIARAAGKADGDAAITGSFHFMAPEQAHGGPPDPRSDLYALAGTWYYALTGLPPFPGSALDALARHREEAPPDPRQRKPEVTERAAALLLRAMSKNPEDRPQTAEEFAAGLSAYGILLDTDTSGSPFRILPAKPREEKPAAPPPPMTLAGTAALTPTPAPAAPARAVPAPPPAPPEPRAAPALGSKTAFLAILAALGTLAFGWQWRRAGPADWAAAAAVLAALPAALTLGDRLQAWRKFAGLCAAAGALAAWFKAAMPAGPAVPMLEAAILAGVGACALAGGTYLGLWGEDRSEALWCRGLSPAAGAALLAAALLWDAPEAQGAAAALTERGAAWWAAFSASGGPWRWGGTVGVGAALAAASHMRGPKGDGRILNWNR